MIDYPLSGSCDLFKFWEIPVSDNILETVQDRDIVAMEKLIGNFMWSIDWHQYQ